MLISTKNFATLCPTIVGSLSLQLLIYIIKVDIIGHKNTFKLMGNWSKKCGWSVLETFFNYVPTYPCGVRAGSALVLRVNMRTVVFFQMNLRSYKEIVGICEALRREACHINTFARLPRPRGASIIRRAIVAVGIIVF